MNYVIKFSVASRWVPEYTNVLKISMTNSGSYLIISGSDAGTSWANKK